MTDIEPLRIAFPLGIGDCHWSCMKLRGLRQLHPGRPVHAFVNASPNHASVEYLKIVEHIDGAFLSSDAPYAINTELPPAYTDRKWATLAGCRGWRGFDYVLVANGHVESGESMDGFIPEVPTEYEYMLRIRGPDEDSMWDLVPWDLPVLIYLSGSGPNTAFHGDIWTVGHWLEVVRRLNEVGIEPVIIGANTESDLGYCQKFIDAGDADYLNIVGKTTIPQLFTLVKRASVWTGLNSGGGIVSAMLRTPTVMFWSDQRYRCGVHEGFVPGMTRNWLSAGQLADYRTFAYGSIGHTPERVAEAISDVRRC